MGIKTQSAEEFLQIYTDEVIAEADDLTDFSEGSIHDIIGGAFTLCLNEISELTVSEFTKLFFNTASGPEITQGEDDLQNLAVDRFGDNFKRPGASSSSVTLTFSRANTDNGNVVIPIGTIAKTEKDLNGNEISFTTLEAATLTGLSVNVSARATTTGTGTNVDPGLIVVIESALTDSSVVVSNAAKAAGGGAAESDAEYRETIRSLIDSLAGATKAAIKGALLAVPEISFVTLLEINMPVIEYDIALDDIKAGSSFFRIPFPVTYIADQNGASSPELIALAQEAIAGVKACGVSVNILGATSQSFSWNASITLKPTGPNYTELAQDPQKIIDTMIEYIDSGIDISSGFIRSQANAQILNIWGPNGTNDLESFITNLPSGNVVGAPGVKLIADNVGIS